MTKSPQRFYLPVDLLTWPIIPLANGAEDRTSVKFPASLDESSRRFAQSVWKAFCATMTCCCRKGFKDIFPGKMFARWVIRSSNPQARAQMCFAIKALSFFARQWAVDGRKPPIPKLAVPRTIVRWVIRHLSNPNACAQFGRLGRLLPTGDKYVEKRALRSHRDIVVSPSYDNIELADAIYYFVRDFFRQRRHLVRRSVSWAPNIGSASYNKTRAEGGRLEELVSDAKEIIEAMFGPGKRWLPRRGTQYWVPDYAGRQVVPDDILDTMIYETALEKTKNTSIFRAKVLGVSEPGYKTRIITVLPAHILVTGDVLRRQVWPVLQAEEWFDGDQLPNKTKFNALFERARGSHHPIVSADLSNATDHVPFRYAQAVWHGILDALGAGKELKDYVNKALGPVELVYPSGERITSRRGIQMGTPLSFTTLCLLHRFAVHCCGFDDLPFLIRGDDLIAAFPSANRYRDFMESIGFKINLTKTIISANGGTFAEQTFNVRRARSAGKFLKYSSRGYLGPIVDVIRLSDLPLKGVAFAEKPILTNIGRWYDQVQTLHNPKRLQRSLCSRVVSIYHGKLVNQAHVLGVPVNCDRLIGGAGIPNRRGKLVIRGFARLVAGFNVSDGRDTQALDAFNRLRDGRKSIADDIARERHARYTRQGELSKLTWYPCLESSPFYQAELRSQLYRTGVNNVIVEPMSLRYWGANWRKLPHVLPKWGTDDLSPLIRGIDNTRGVYCPPV